MSAASAISDQDEGPSSHSHESNSGSGCTYCGLPVQAAGSPVGSVLPALYCCYGCRFAHAVVQEQGDQRAIRWTVIRLGLAIFFTMNLMAFTMTMWSLDVYDVKPDPFQLTLFEVFRWLSMLLALPVLLLLGVPLIQSAFESWRRRVYSTDVLIVLAVVAAYLTSVVNVLRESGAIYFEVGATVLVMITLGRWIEAAGKQKATESLDNLLTLLPDTVSRVKQNETIISAAEITVGDTLRIRAGERFPTDAVICRGQTAVDEQVFTGESQPVTKAVGDSVLAGTVNLEGDVLVEVSAGFKQGAFGRLLQTLQDTRNARGYHQRLAETVASWFFPLIAVIAFGTFVWHLSTGIGFAIQSTMSVLLIACPCALGLATPLAVWTALSTAIRHQVLFRSGEAIERLASAKAVCFDKTGTLTTGTPHVFQTAFFGDDDAKKILQLAGQLADSSSHPFSKAVAGYVSADAKMPISSPDSSVPSRPEVMRQIKTVSGGGVQATTDDGRVVRLGSVEFACCKLHDAATGEGESSLELCVTCKATVSLGLRVRLDRLRMAADQQAASIVLLSVNRMPTVGFLIAETLRPEAKAALQLLADSTKSLHVLTGDRPAKGQSLREQLQVRGLSVECSLNPEQKVARVIDVRQRYGTTVMVGDGINDAPALAVSDVGVAMGCGADVSRDSARVCLLSNDLTQIPWAIDLARRTTSVIRQNLFWAFGYNTVGICLAATGVLNPAIAAGLMIASSLIVISNSLRLLRDKPNGNGHASENHTSNRRPKSEPGCSAIVKSAVVEPGLPSQAQSSSSLANAQAQESIAEPLI